MHDELKKGLYEWPDVPENESAIIAINNQIPTLTTWLDILMNKLQVTIWGFKHEKPPTNDTTIPGFCIVIMFYA